MTMFVKLKHNTLNTSTVALEGQMILRGTIVCCRCVRNGPKGNDRSIVVSSTGCCYPAPRLFPHSFPSGLARDVAAASVFSAFQEHDQEHSLPKLVSHVVPPIFVPPVTAPQCLHSLWPPHVCPLMSAPLCDCPLPPMAAFSMYAPPLPLITVPPVSVPPLCSPP